MWKTSAAIDISEKTGGLISHTHSEREREIFTKKMVCLFPTQYFVVNILILVFQIFIKVNSAQWHHCRTLSQMIHTNHSNDLPARNCPFNVVHSKFRGRSALLNILEGCRFE